MNFPEIYSCFSLADLAAGPVHIAVHIPGLEVALAPGAENPTVGQRVEVAVNPDLAAGPVSQSGNKKRILLHQPNLPPRWSGRGRGLDLVRALVLVLGQCQGHLLVQVWIKLHVLDML